MPMLTEQQGAHDYSLGIEPNPEGGQAYFSGYYGKYTDINGVGGFIYGEQCADQGYPLPDKASSDFKRGHACRTDINQIRGKR